MLSVIASSMPEKREGQQIIRFFVPFEKKELFREYCGFVSKSMTEVLESHINELLSNENFQAYLAMKRQLQQGKKEDQSNEQ